MTFIYTGIQLIGAKLSCLCFVLLIGCFGNKGSSVELTQDTRLVQAPKQLALIAPSPTDAGPDVLLPSPDPPAKLNSSLPPAPDSPKRPAQLSVPNFYPASHVGPDDTSSWPMPVTIVLHGNYDRPEWECDTWKRVAGFHGWVLCPRGVRSKYATLAQDRWTYRGPAVVQKEIQAALGALEERYPGRVSRDKTVLAGFSLGAIYAPGLAIKYSGQYPYLFLVEGGVKKIDKQRIRLLKRAEVLGVALAMSAPGRRRMARKLLKKLIATGMRAVFVDMKGAGHAYRNDFATTGRNALEKLVSQVNRNQEPKGAP